MEPLANDSFEARIVRALDERAETAVPTDFAARVVSALPAVRPVRRESHAGRTMAVVLAVVLLAVMAWLAPLSASNAGMTNPAFDVEMALCLLLAAMAFAMAKVWDRV